MIDNRFRTAFCVAFFVLIAAAATGAPIYMKYDGVEGDVARGKEKWIEIQNWDFGADREGKLSCASQTATFTVSVDSKALPGLTKAAQTRKTFRELTVDADGEIHTLQGARVKKVDSITVKQRTVELTYGRCLTHAKPSSKK